MIAHLQNILQSLNCRWLATISAIGAWTMSELQAFELWLRILTGVCALIVGIPTAIATLWRGYLLFKTLRNSSKKH